MTSEKPILPKAPLGRTGFELSRLGLGGFHQLEISSEIVGRVVDAFLDAGGNYIETARGYGVGASEKKLGAVLEGRRDRVVLASKSGKADAEGIRKDLETTLENLRTDHIEFYFFHGVGSEAHLDALCKPGGALDALLKARDEGLIRGVGVSSHRPELYLEAMRRLPLSLILVWCNYLEDQYLPIIRNEILPMAREKGVGITAMKPLGDGYLWRSVRPAMRYALGMGAEVLVSGMNSVRHVKEAVEAVCSGPADPAEMAAILTEAPELGNYVCRQCGKCGAELMELFRLEGFVDRQMLDYQEHDPPDYALRMRLAGWFHLADSAREILKSRNWSEADLLSEARGVGCPYRIDVPRKTRLAWAKLTGDPNLV